MEYLGPLTVKSTLGLEDIYVDVIGECGCEPYVSGARSHVQAQPCDGSNADLDALEQIVNLPSTTAAGRLAATDFKTALSTCLSRMSFLKYLFCHRWGYLCRKSQPQTWPSPSLYQEATKHPKSLHLLRLPSQTPLRRRTPLLWTRTMKFLD